MNWRVEIILIWWQRLGASFTAQSQMISSLSMVIRAWASSPSILTPLYLYLGTCQIKWPNWRIYFRLQYFIFSNSEWSSIDPPNNKQSSKSPPIHFPHSFQAPISLRGPMNAWYLLLLTSPSFSAVAKLKSSQGRWEQGEREVMVRVFLSYCFSWISSWASGEVLLVEGNSVFERFINRKSNCRQRTWIWRWKIPGSVNRTTTSFQFWLWQWSVSQVLLFSWTVRKDIGSSF